MRPFLLLLALLLPTLGLAAESEQVRTARTTATLVADAAAIAPGEPFRLGLRLRLAPGWHTYWVNPGDAGAAPELDLTLPAGAEAGPIAWPAPTRIPFGPLISFAYDGEVLLPLTLTPPAGLAPGDRFPIAAEARWLVCAQVCIPEEGRFTLDLPVAAAATPDQRLGVAFALADAALPRPAPGPANVAWAADRATLRVDGLPPGAASFFAATQGLLDPAAPRVDGTALVLTPLPGVAPPAKLDGVVTVTDPAGGRVAFAVSAPVAAAPARLGLVEALLGALLGGLILNLMPCVFPVLAMKAMAIARLGGANRGAVRAKAASFTAGVLVAFLALGGALIALRAGGLAAGWGFQFTSPAFVAVLGWLMLAVGLNLSGVFAVGGGEGLGQGLAARGGHLGSAATGALAVVVATPCTAPFMAAAIGAALAMPVPATLAVFAALGLGLAAPQGVLALFPGLATRLPRPGAWMERLRQGLAFPMYAAAAWLVWVLARLAGLDALALALAGGVLVGLAAWAAGVTQRGGFRAGRWVAGVAGVAALALLPALAAAPPPAAAASDTAWSAARVAAAQAEGRPVFVNLTAAWCVSCQVNDRLVLRSEAVRAGFARAGVLVLKGDWTAGDPAIGALIRAQGREGVPLYLLYPARGGPPRILPELLTQGIVLGAVAGG